MENDQDADMKEEEEVWEGPTLLPSELDQAYVHYKESLTKPEKAEMLYIEEAEVLLELPTWPEDKRPPVEKVLAALKDPKYMAEVGEVFTQAMVGLGALKHAKYKEDDAVQAVLLAIMSRHVLLDEASKDGLWRLCQMCMYLVYASTELWWGFKWILIPALWGMRKMDFTQAKQKEFIGYFGSKVGKVQLSRDIVDKVNITIASILVADFAQWSSWYYYWLVYCIIILGLCWLPGGELKHEVSQDKDAITVMRKVFATPVYLLVMYYSWNTYWNLLCFTAFMYPTTMKYTFPVVFGIVLLTLSVCVDYRDAAMSALRLPKFWPARILFALICLWYYWASESWLMLFLFVFSLVMVLPGGQLLGEIAELCIRAFAK